MNESSKRGPGAEPKARVFISYSRKDMGFADNLEAALKARGFEPLIDRTEIYAFEDWWRRIQNLIAKADTIIFVLSPDAVSSDICRKEVAFAASLNKRFAPIVCRPVDVANVPTELSRLNFISFEDQTHFERNADQLEDALSTNIEWIRKHTEFGELSRRWEEAGKPRGLLLRSPALEEAETWIARQPRRAPAPTQATPLFILESRKAENLARVRARRTRIVLGVLALMLIGAGVGWWKQDWLKEQYQWRVVMGPTVLMSERERALAPKDEFTECTHGCPMMVVVPPGRFMMGSPESAGRVDRESPQHPVTIGKPLAVGKFDVTFAEWDTCTDAGACPRAPDNGWGRENRPVINVSWNDAKDYVSWLSRVTGKRYRLLSEAEWEYVARAGTTTAYYWGDDIGTGNANCGGCGGRLYAATPVGDATTPVGSFKPNAFGLYDMLGNVWQWVEDVYRWTYKDAPDDGSAWIDESGGNRVIRGGSWDISLGLLHVALRERNPTVYRNFDVGFRVARTLSQ
jgi:formylglycine-generating enzyme required for sulfatase activity